MSVTIVRDLRPAFGTARSQGSRPTCCAFACSDLHAACRPPWIPLSCEYAFYHGAQRQGTGPASSVYLRHMLAAIEHDGQPVEAGWPYLPSVPADLTRWTPPADVGQIFRAKGVPSPGAPSSIRASVDQGRPVLIVMSLSDAFYLGTDADDVIAAADPLDATRVHALIAVGHGTRGPDIVTLVRNSWGAGWGASGYAWLSDRYLAPRIIELATMTQVL